MSSQRPDRLDALDDAGGDIVDFDGRDPWSSRTWVVVLVTLAAVVGGGWLVEDRLRASEEAALAACEAGAREALDNADTRFAARADYLRPALMGVAEEGRDSLFALMAETAVTQRDEVRAALGRCEDVTPVWFHPGLGDRRDAVVRHLTRRVALIDAIALDGRVYYRDTPVLDAERERVLGAPD